MSSEVKINIKYKKHWIKLFLQIYKLFLNKKNKQPYLTNLSYNKISGLYDEAWSNNMRELSKEMINRLSLPIKGKGLDLTCGTGFVSSLLKGIVDGEVTGVDSSEGMINTANKKYGNTCNFVCSDIFEYLNKQPSKSVDVVTCAWGMGYTKPFKLIKEISRILKPNGQVAIIDSNLFTIFEVVKSGILTVAEYPSA
ncbi:MAG: class I SAM-dependent methyltransferase, partial [Candidatus Thermoplasmatota archaeon]|nr:class I SAM-dependent methyltransferase [Candidatus Thermoplasmatota archaeon]